MLTIGRLDPADRDAWETLFRGYIDFYERSEPPEMYERAWREFQADTRLHALGAKLDGTLVGITHFFPHPSTSGPDVCYLQDLFTAPEARGQGAARALIAGVADWATAQRLPARLLAHPRVQRHRPPPVRQGRPAPRLHQYQLPLPS